MTRHRFHADLRQEHAEAARATANALGFVFVGALVLGVFCIWTQWDRITDPEQVPYAWEFRHG